MRGNICVEHELECTSLIEIKWRIYLSISSLKKKIQDFKLKKKKIINLGKAQIFMNISSSENSNRN